MKSTIFLLLAVAALAATVAFTAQASRVPADDVPVFVTEIPQGYREWRLVSVAHEEGNLNDIRAILERVLKSARHFDECDTDERHYARSRRDAGNGAARSITDRDT